MYSYDFGWHHRCKFMSFLFCLVPKRYVSVFPLVILKQTSGPFTFNWTMSVCCIFWNHEYGWFWEYFKLADSLVDISFVVSFSWDFYSLPLLFIGICQIFLTYFYWFFFFLCIPLWIHFPFRFLWGKWELVVFPGG